MELEVIYNRIRLIRIDLEAETSREFIFDQVQALEKELAIYILQNQRRYEMWLKTIEELEDETCE